MVLPPGTYFSIDVALLATLPITHIPVLVFFFLKRNSAIFRNGVSIELSMLMIVAFFAAAAWKLFCSLYAIECLYDQVFSNFTYFVVTVLYMHRSIRLLFRSEIQDRLETFRKLPRLEQTSEALLTGKGGWYFRHRYLIRNRNSFIYLFISFVLWLGLNLAVGASAGTLDCGQPNVMNYLLWSMDIVFLVPTVIVVVLRLRRHSNDAFNLRRDLKYIGISAIVITLLSIGVLQALPSKDPTDVVFVNGLFSYVTHGWFLTLSGYVMMSVLLKFSKVGVVGDLTSLENLLNYSKGYDSFLSYMKTEFNGENVLFWQSIQEYRAKHLGQLNFSACFQEAQEIMTKYIETGSVMELNIDTEMRAQLVENFASYTKMKKQWDVENQAIDSPTPRKSSLLRSHSRQGSHSDGHQPHASSAKLPSTEQLGIVTMFDAVQAEIYDLMKADPFRRYLASKIYADFKASEPSQQSQSEAPAGSMLLVSTGGPNLSLIDRAKRFMKGSKTLESQGESATSDGGSAQASRAETASIDHEPASHAGAMPLQ